MAASPSHDTWETLWGLSREVPAVDALATLVDDEHSSMYRDFDGAVDVMKEILFTNPAAVHHIPLEP